MLYTLRTLESDALKAKISLVKAFQIVIFIKIRGGAFTGKE